MLLNWMAGLQDRLNTAGKRRSKPVSRGRGLRRTSTPAAVEILESRRVMSADAVDDSYQIQQQMMPVSTVLDVLANDTTTGGTLTITSVVSPASGTVSIQHDPMASMYQMYGMTPPPDKLVFTPAYGYVGTESFSYTVTNMSGEQATGTVTVNVSSGSSGGGMSGMGGGSAAAAPQVNGLMNSSGSTAGGTSVYISGTGLGQVTQVMFGNTQATSFTVTSDSSITAVAPPHAQGPVDVTVVSPAGTSSPSSMGQFTYTPMNKMIDIEKPAADTTDRLRTKPQARPVTTPNTRINHNECSGSNRKNFENVVESLGQNTVGYLTHTHTHTHTHTQIFQITFLLLRNREVSQILTSSTTPPVSLLMCSTL